MSRILAREITFKLVFENLFLKIKNDLTLENFIQSEDLTEDDKSFINNSYVNILIKEKEIENIIEQHLENYKLERIYKVDLAILILATYELLNCDVSTAVIINEAVELAKKYSTEKSSSFINGVLAKISKERLDNGK